MQRIKKQKRGECMNIGLLVVLGIVVAIAYVLLTAEGGEWVETTSSPYTDMRREEKRSEYWNS